MFIYFPYQTRTLNLFIVLLYFSLNFFSHITLLCVSIIFISHAVFMKLNDYISQMVFHYSYVFLLLSRWDIYPIKNIQYFQQSIKTFMLTEVVWPYFYFRNIILTKYIQHENVISIYSQHSMLDSLFMLYWITNIQC